MCFCDRVTVREELQPAVPVPVRPIVKTCTPKSATITGLVATQEFCDEHCRYEDDLITDGLRGPCMFVCTCTLIQ